MRVPRAPLIAVLALLVLALPPASAAQQAGVPGAGAPLPPATPIQDLKPLVGRWEGKIMPRTGGSEPVVWVIHPDGSYDQEPFGHRGTLEIKDGKLRWRNLTTGRSGTIILHEGGGRRVLRGVPDGGDFTWELMPAATAARRAEGPRPAVSIGILTINPMRELYQQALGELGYVDGKTVALEYRLGPPGRLPELAAELVRLKVNVILASGTAPALAAKRATATIPIVFSSADPVAGGLVPSLARPGGNLTGVSATSVDLSAKRLQLLAEAVPGLARVGVLANATHPAAAAQLRELDMAAGALKLGLRTFEVRAQGEVEPAFASMAREAVQAVVVLIDPVLLMADLTIARLAAQHRLPLIAESRQYVTPGGLMSYGPSFAALVHQSVRYVDRILKGARPANLPVEQPTRFELAVNLRTARALGLTLPPSLLLRADQVIE